GRQQQAAPPPRPAPREPGAPAVGEGGAGRPPPAAAAMPRRRAPPRLSDRKLRLFTCACLRRLTHRLADLHFVRAVEATEEYADGLIPKRAMKRARKAAGLRWLDCYFPSEEAFRAVRAVAQVTPHGDQAALCALL